MEQSCGVEPYRLMFIGHTGSGKSALTASLVEKKKPSAGVYDSDEEYSMPKILDISTSDYDARGTTKEPEQFSGITVGNKKLELFDLPGTGDRDVGAEDIISMVETVSAMKEEPINSIVCVIPADKPNQGTDVTLMKILAVDGLLKDPENTFDSLMVVFTGADKATPAARKFISERHLDVLYKDAPPHTEKRYCFTKGLELDAFGQPVVDAEGRPSLDITEFKELLKSMPIKTLKPTEMKEDVLKKYLHALNINDQEKVNEIFEVIIGERNLRKQAEEMCETWENGDHKAALKQIRKELLKKTAPAADQKERVVAQKQLEYLTNVGYPGTTEKERRVNRTDLIDFAEHLKLRSHRSPGNFPKGVLKKGAQRHLFCYARKNSDYNTSALKDIIEKRLAAKRDRSRKAAKTPSPSKKKPRRAPKRR